MLHGGQLFIRLAEFSHTAARRQTRRVSTVGMAPPGETPLVELLLIPLQEHRKCNIFSPFVAATYTAKFVSYRSVVVAWQAGAAGHWSNHCHGRWRSGRLALLGRKSWGWAVTDKRHTNGTVTKGAKTTTTMANRCLNQQS